MKTNEVSLVGATQKAARLAGALYLIYIVLSIAANGLGRSGLIVLGDAATTAANIMASPWQFRAGFVIDLASAVLFLLTAWALYTLLKPVKQNLALLFLLLNLGGVAVSCFSDLFLIASQLLLSGPNYLSVFQADQVKALAMFCLYLYEVGFQGIAQLFFGAWLFPLGYLVYKSGFLPKILGLILMVHCVVWLSGALQFLLFPGLMGTAFAGITYISYPLGFISEFGLTLGLLIRGVKPQKPALLSPLRPG
jgi:hypothetical protein